MFKMKDGYKVELKMPETRKLFGSIKKKKLIDKTKNREKVLSFEVVKVVLLEMQFSR